MVDFWNVTGIITVINNNKIEKKQTTPSPTVPRCT